MIVFGYRDGDPDRVLVAWQSMGDVRAGVAPVAVEPVGDGWRVTTTPAPVSGFDVFTLMSGGGDVSRRPGGVWLVDVDGGGDRWILRKRDVEGPWRVERRVNTPIVLVDVYAVAYAGGVVSAGLSHEFHDASADTVSVWYQDDNGSPDGHLLTFDRNARGFWRVARGYWQEFPPGFRVLADAIRWAAACSGWVMVTNGSVWV